MKIVYFFSILVFSLVHAFAQYAPVSCGADDIHAERYATNSIYRAAYDRTKAYMLEKGISNYKTVTTGGGTEYHIPVVVHVLHTGGAVGSNYNPSDATINALIAQMNNGFANTFDHTAISGTFNGVNIPIRFFLAQRTDACSSTSGINRIDLSSNATYLSNGVRTNISNPGVSDTVIKSVVHWNDLNYYNIYIVHKINGEDGYTSATSYVAGYAYYPVLGGQRVDGMVCLAYAAANPSSTVFIHELGHGFNLAHTFQGGTSSICPPNTLNCLLDDDEVCDTEPMQLSFLCNPSGNNPCTGNLFTGGQWNYMSYNGCADRFTNGQQNRVMNALNLVRTSLKNSAGVDGPPASLPIPSAPVTFNPANLAHGYDDGPRRVTFHAIDHTSSGYANEGSGNVFYTDNTCNQSTTVIAGNTYPLQVLTIGSTQSVKVFIDFNNDGVFSATAPEMVMASVNAATSFVHTASVTIPLNAVQQTPLRMRVISDFGNVLASMTPNMQLDFGQAEDYTITVTNAALPVVWRSISAHINSQQFIDVRWTTEMERNSDYYTIEKSKDGIHFYPTGKIQAAGHSDMPLHYAFEDTHNITGNNYYRVKQVDVDQQYSYSSVVHEYIHADELDVLLHPNPVNHELHMSIAGMKHADNNIRVSITDMHGRVWFTSTERVAGVNSSLYLDLSDIPSGMYMAQCVINGKLSVHKFVKQP